MAQNTSPASDADIKALVDTLAAQNGATFIPANASWTLDMLETGRKLALACGAPERAVTKMRSHELAAFYMSARKSPDGGRRLALRRGGAATPPPMPEAVQTRPEAPSVPPQAVPTATGEPLPAVALPTASLETVREALAVLSRDLTGEARLATQETLQKHLEAMPGLVSELLGKIVPRKVTVQVQDLPPVTVEHAHAVLPRVLRKVLAGDNVYLFGGMGTGKTTLAEQIAKITGREFAMASSVFEEHKLFGFFSASTNKKTDEPIYVSTDFRRIFEFGGVFLFDEMDRSDPSVVVAFNAAVANGFVAFPDKIVYRHADCILIAAGNTCMRGASREFNSAQKQDSSVLDRWQVIAVELDLQLETSVCINDAWLSYCRALRAEAASQKVDLAVTPRASIVGAKAIAQGDTWAEAADSVIWKGLDKASRDRLEQSVPMSAYEPF